MMRLRGVRLGALGVALGLSGGGSAWADEVTEPPLPVLVVNSGEKQAVPVRSVLLPRPLNYAKRIAVSRALTGTMLYTVPAKGAFSEAVVQIEQVSFSVVGRSGDELPRPDCWISNPPSEGGGDNTLHSVQLHRTDNPGEVLPFMGTLPIRLTLEPETTIELGCHLHATRTVDVHFSIAGRVEGY